ncbi:hypothetical protein FRC11_008409 [Ceratobasidium sp. 423]|nr:hypothetical protein FRC11_008409 [Ceratobasidium sp. 423]
MVCVGILTEEGIFDKTLESINPDTPWQTISGCLAQKVMLDVLKDKPPLESECILGDVSKYRGAFAMHGGLSPGDAAFLSHVIWKSRKAIIPLRRQGLLPGLPVLILVLCQMTILSKTQKPVTQPWVRMQDLLMRCYLGDMTTDEQIILRWLGMSTYRLAIESKVKDINEHSPVDELDLRVIAQAYIELWTPSSESSGAQNTYLDLPMAVSGWIYHLMDVPGQQELRAEELVPRLIKVGFDLLAHELDVEQHNPQSASQKQFLGVGGLIIALLQHISYIVPAIKSPAVREDFICSLHEFDFYGLVGRGLLLVTRESDTANEPGSTYIRVGLELIQCLKRFRRDLLALPAPPYCLLESADIEWRKVDSLLHYKLYSCLHVPAPLYEAAMKAWRGVYPPSIVEEFNYYQCALAHGYMDEPQKQNYAVQNAGRPNIAV